MIVSENPSRSRAVRIARTCPSIIALGATTSAPARARLTAVRASSSTDASLSMRPSTTTPQCPWSAYSHRQTSAIATMSGASALIARRAFWTTPVSEYAPRARSSLDAGTPKRRRPFSPRSERVAASAAASGTVSRRNPGNDGTVGSIRSSSRTNSGAMSWETSQRVSRIRSLIAAVRRNRRGRRARVVTSTTSRHLPERAHESGHRVLASHLGDAESARLRGLRSHRPDARDLRMVLQRNDVLPWQERDEVLHRRTTREDDQVDPVRRGKARAIGRGRPRLVRVDLVDVGASRPEPIGEGPSSEARPEEQYTSAGQRPEDVRDRVRPELAGHRINGEAFRLRDGLRGGPHGCDSRGPRTQLEPQGPRSLDRRSHSVRAREDDPIVGPPSPKSSIELGAIGRGSDSHGRERDGVRPRTPQGGRNRLRALFAGDDEDRPARERPFHVDRLPGERILNSRDESLRARIVGPRLNRQGSLARRRGHEVGVDRLDVRTRDTQPMEPRRGDDDRVQILRLEAPQPRPDVPMEFHDFELGAEREQLRTTA